MPVFDLAAKVVGADQRAYVVHAGKSRRNHLSFVQNSMAYLEVPDIGLTPAIAASKSLLRQAIRRYNARRRFAENPSGVARPVEDLRSYSDESLADNGQHVLTGSVHALYSKLKVGDIVITPGFENLGKYKRPIVHFGEISAPFAEEDVFTGGTVTTQKVPFRKVTWLTTVERRQIPPALEVQISKPPAVREIKLVDDLNDILKLTYSNYIYDDGSSSLIRADRYQAKEFATLNDASDLIATLIAGYAFATEAKLAKAGTISDMDVFRRHYLALSGVENIEINFASPGTWRILGASATMAMFVALGIAVLTSDLSSAQMQAGIDITNTASISSGTEQDLKESIDIFIQSLDQAEVDRLKKIAGDARDRIGLTSSVHVLR